MNDGPDITSTGLYRLTQWITKLAYLNLLWLMFSILGLGVLGVFPSTSGVFSLCRKWAMKEDVPIFRTFVGNYKKEFFRSNILGYVLLIIGLIIHYDLVFVHNKFINFGAHILILMFFMMLVYIGPVFSHFDTNLLSQFKLSILLSFTHPIKTLIMMASVVALIYVMLTFLKMIPFFSISLLAFILTKIAYKTLLVNGSEQGAEIGPANS